MVNNTNNARRTPAFIIMIILIPSLLFTPAYAAATDAPVQGPAAEAAATDAPVTAAPVSGVRTRTARPAKVSLADAVSTAEKMYYSGELYLFADSMVRTNYEMAAIAAAVKTSVQSGALLRNRSVINTLAKNYNSISVKYNSWVDVKGDLEFFIDTIGPRNTITKSQLQTVFSRTVKTVNETKALLEKADDYYGNKSTESRRALTGAADNLTSAAVKAVNAISPVSQKTLTGYRALFDQFAAQANLELEYKTWSNPEADIDVEFAAEP